MSKRLERKKLRKSFSLEENSLYHYRELENYLLSFQNEHRYFYIYVLVQREIVSFLAGGVGYGNH